MERPNRLHLSIALLSASVVAFQISLMQIFSIVQWSHFASMVISVALLGFGASGTAVALARRRLMHCSPSCVAAFAVASGASMTLAVAASQSDAVRFDSLLLFTGGEGLLRLVCTYLLLFVPFFLAALALALLILREVADVGTRYFANLVGSGIGAVTAVCGLWWLPPQQFVAVVSLLPMVSGVLIAFRHARGRLIAFAGGALILQVWLTISPPPLVPSEFKSLRRTMQLPNAEVIAHQNSPQGQMHVVRSSALRYAPGLSLTYPHPVPSVRGVFLNGDWSGPVVDSSFMIAADYLRFTTAQLPYVFLHRPHVVVLQAGTGWNSALASVNDAAGVVLVESNSLICSMLRKGIGVFPNVTVREEEPRSFLSHDTSRYDHVAMPTVGIFGGGSGLYATQEQFLLTVEGFREARRHLTPEGVLSVSCWMDVPYRNAPRLLAVISKVLETDGVAEPADHIIAIRGWGMITVAVRQRAFDDDDVRQTREFCRLMSFDPLILRGATTGERSHYNTLDDPSFLSLIDNVMSPARDSLLAAYEFSITPATDDRPYFSQFLRLKNLLHVKQVMGLHSVPYLELAYLMNALTLMQVVIVAVALILMPLLVRSPLRTHRIWTVAYFGSLGLGYMLVEIVLIQRFILYFGHPIYAASAVIATMLVASGIGSWFSSKLVHSWQTIVIVASVAGVIVLLCALFLSILLTATCGSNFFVKLTIAIVVIGVPALVMGMLFPLGLRRLAETAEQNLGWAWGVNGCASVVSAVLASFLAIEAGFAIVMLLAAGSYGVAALVSIRTR